MRNKLFYSLVGGIVLVNLATLFVWWNKTYKYKRSDEAPQRTATFYQYGDRAPSFRLRTLSGLEVNSDSLRGKTTLIEFFDPQDEHHWALISYANLLAKTYRDEGLEVIAVAKGQPSNQARLIENISIPIVADDDSLSVQNLFHLQKCCGGTVLVDTNGVIRFISPYIASTNLTKQIVEGQLKKIHADAL